MQESAHGLSGHSSGSYYVWEPAGHGMAILLNLKVVERLKQALEADHERGGILLGRAEPSSGTNRRVTVIEDYEPAGCEHVRGPAYYLSGNDKADFKKRLRFHSGRANYPVGFFRTHLRKGMYLDEADFSIAREFFSGPGDVMMIARPEQGDVPRAGFFFWQDGRMQRQSSYMPFPLDRAALESAGYAILQGSDRHDGTSAERPATRTSPIAREPAPAVRRTHISNRALYAALAAVLLLLMPVVWWAATRAGKVQETGIQLGVQRTGQALRLTWDPGTQVVRSANDAVVLISDGGQERRMHLDSEQLKEGSVLYIPHSTDVSFRMDLRKIAQEGTESVRFLSEQSPSVAMQSPVTSSPVTSTAPAPGVRSVPKIVTAPPQAVVRRAPVQVARVQAKPNPAPAVNKAEPPAQPPAQPPAPVQSPAEISSADRARMERPAEPRAAAEPEVKSAPDREPAKEVRVQRPRMEPSVIITTHPAPPPKIRQMVEKVPLVRMIQSREYKAGSDFRPARPYREVTPRVPPRIARELPGEWRVDLKLKIDSGGRVKDIDALSPRADGRLVDLAADAMSRWRFEPARLRDKPISSEMYVVLRFRNPPSDSFASARHP